MPISYRLFLVHLFSVAREIKILRAIAHPHVIRLYGAIKTRTEILMVLEYMKCGDLFDYITEKGYIQEDEGSHLFQQVVLLKLINLLICF